MDEPPASPDADRAKLVRRIRDLERVQAIANVGGVHIEIGGGLIGYRSPEYRRLHGLPADRETEPHEAWLARIHPEDRASADQSFRDAIAGTGVIYESEYRIVRPSDGETRWIYAKADIERDTQGKAVRLIGAHTDITARRLAETALRDSERRFRTLVAASSEVIYSHTADWKQMRQLSGGGFLSDTVAPDPDWFDKYIHPDDQPHVWSVIQDAIGNKSVFSLEHRVIQADGTLGWTASRSVPHLNEAGEIIEWFGAASDVTDRKRAELALADSEERLRLALAVGGFASWDWDVVTGDVVWSREHFQMLGYDIDEVRPGYEAWVARVHPEDLQAAEAALARARDNREEYAHLFRAYHPGGRVVWCAARGRYFYDAAGKAVRMIGVMQDVTEEKVAVERTRVLVAELQHRTRNLIALIQGIAHQTAKSTDSLDLFQKRFKERLAALSRVQGLLSRPDEGATSIGALIGMEFDALAIGEARDRVQMSGPDIPLPPARMQTVALLIHELATNAYKHGALAGENGVLKVAWRVVDRSDGTIMELQWVETGYIPKQTGTKKSGFGRELIERALPYSMGAGTSFELDSTGLKCRISFPLVSATVG